MLHLVRIMKYYAIIVAGGSGSRMNAAIPKQFLLLDDKPVLIHTIEAFYRSDLSPEIILVLPSSYHAYWKEICIQYDFKISHTVISGGKERFFSVKNALDIVPDDSIVAIHDAVRPVVSSDLIRRCYSEAVRAGTAIPVVESRDSLRKKEDDTSRAIARDEILIVQTPQVFQSRLLKKAYLQEYTPAFTDDASVAEKAGISIHTTEGDHKNLKITFPQDLAIASLFIKEMI